MNPTEQFEISTLKSLGTLGRYHFAFTTSATYMLLCFAIIAGVTLFAMRGNALVPGRLQSGVETIYEFIADTVRQSAGEEGMKFFPFIFSIFAFVLVCNLIGLVPYSFTVTSHIIITASLAVLVFIIVIGYGFWKNGLKLPPAFRSFRRAGLAPAADCRHRDDLLPVAALEPFGASVRQHAGGPYGAQHHRELRRHPVGRGALGGALSRCPWP